MVLDHCPDPLCKSVSCLGCITEDFVRVKIILDNWLKFFNNLFFHVVFVKFFAVIKKRSTKNSLLTCGPPVGLLCFSCSCINDWLLKDNDKSLNNNDSSWRWFCESFQLCDICWLQLSDSSKCEVVDWHDSAQFVFAIFLDGISILLLFFSNCFFSLDQDSLFLDFLLLGFDNNNLFSCFFLGLCETWKEILQLNLKCTDFFLRF